jgi:uncharacterized membrane protein YeaQ/YmgE (transglycosylase-associated protein family)
MSFLYFILIGAIAGWLAGLAMKGRGFGVIGNIVVGVIGAVLGGFLVTLAGFSTDGDLLPQLITAFIGSVVLLVIIGVLKKA